MREETFTRSVFADTLTELLQECGALTALLVTRQGTAVAECGDRSYLNTTAMAALVAGMFSATHEVARMVGEEQFSILLQQGERRHVYISLVAGKTMMVVIFEDQNRLGMVRHAARKAGRTLAAVVSSSWQREKAHAEIPLSEFKEYALNLIDRIFQP